MESDIPKQYLKLAGHSILQHAVNSFLTNSTIETVYVVVSETDVNVDTALADHHKLHVLRCGGASRQETVRNGLRCIAQMQDLAYSDWILVHDAARPGLTSELIDQLITKVGQDQSGGLLALPVVDTVKRSHAGRTETISRAALWLAQTPQMFGFGLLCDALDAASKGGIAVTDEASAIEAFGHHPQLVIGHGNNRKLTLPEDLAFFEMLIDRKLELSKNEK